MSIRRVVGTALVAAGFTVMMTAVHAGDPCCSVKSVDRVTRMVTVVETSTGCICQFQTRDAKGLMSLRPGQPIDIDVRSLKVIGREPMGRTAQAVGAGGTMSTPTNTCGSNVDRNADTKVPPCMVLTVDKGWVPCSNPPPPPPPKK